MRVVRKETSIPALTSSFRHPPSTQRGALSHLQLRDELRVVLALHVQFQPAELVRSDGDRASGACDGKLRLRRAQALQQVV